LIPGVAITEPIRAGVHRSRQHKGGREGQRHRGAADRHLPVFERLPEDFEDRTVELGQLVEEEHAVVREADLARPRHGPAATQARVADRVVRRAEGARGDEADAVREARHRMNLGQLKRGLEFERRQYCRQPAREHRLAGAGRADQQDVVRAGRGDFERPLGRLLAADLAEVHLVAPLIGEQLVAVNADGARARRGVAAQRRDQLDRPAQGRRAVHVNALDDGRLGRVLLGQDEVADSGLARAQRDGKRPADRPHPAVERQLADGERAGEAFALSEVAVRAEHPERDGQVEARAALAHVRRREVDRRLVEGEEEAAVVDRRADALARLADREVGQADDGHGRRRVRLAARRREVNFDVYEVCVNAVDGGGLRAEEHGFGEASARPRGGGADGAAAGAAL
jgi:hypothetical protein